MFFFNSIKAYILIIVLGVLLIYLQLLGIFTIVCFQYFWQFIKLLCFKLLISYKFYSLLTYFIFLQFFFTIVKSFFDLNIKNIVIIFYSIMLLTILSIFFIYLLINFFFHFTGIIFDLGRFFFFLNFFEINILFYIDIQVLLLVLTVLGLTILILLFSIEYLKGHCEIFRFLTLLYLFTISVIFFFLSFDILLLVFWWECIGLSSFLLVTFYFSSLNNIKASLKVFIFSRISDGFMFLLLVYICKLFGTSNLFIILNSVGMYNDYSFGNILYTNNTAVLSIFIIGAALLKSAQAIFSIWLCDAMEAPTPASALIHSSTLVVIGIHLLNRFHIFILNLSIISNIILILAALTILINSINALYQKHIKKIIAQSTISQIAYLMLGTISAGIGSTSVQLITHAFNKAIFFIIVGHICKNFKGIININRMGGKGLQLFNFTIIICFVVLNLVSIMGSVGCIGKECIFYSITLTSTMSLFIYNGWIFTLYSTFLYSFRLVSGALFGFKRSSINNYSNLSSSKLYETNLINTYKNYSLSAYYLYKKNQLNEDYSNIAIVSYFSFLFLL